MPYHSKTFAIRTIFLSIPDFWQDSGSHETGQAIQSPKQSLSLSDQRAGQDRCCPQALRRGRTSRPLLGGTMKPPRPLQKPDRSTRSVSGCSQIEESTVQSGAQRRAPVRGDPFNPKSCLRLDGFPETAVCDTRLSMGARLTLMLIEWHALRVGPPRVKCRRPGAALG